MGHILCDFSSSVRNHSVAGLGFGAMEKSETAPTEILEVSLSGGFLATAGDEEVVVPSLMSRRLIAILCRSEGMRRPRLYLQNILWECGVADPSSSLRQLLVQTRKRLGGFASHLEADAVSVSLINVRDVTDAPRMQNLDFFEDAGFGTEEFEDWLRHERAVFREKAEDSLPAPTITREERYPVIGLACGDLNFLDSRQAVVSDWIGNLFSEVFSWSDFVQFHDLRKNNAGVECDLEVCVSVLPIGDTFDISVAVQDNGRCVWSRSVQVPSGSELPNHRERLLEFAQLTAARIETLIPMLAERWNGSGKPILNLHHVVSRLFTMRPNEVVGAAEILNDFDSIDQMSTVLAWQGFGKMLMSGERLVADRVAALQEAESLIGTALDIDRTNATALSIASHFQAFVKRDLYAARDLSDHALSLVPFSPLARDVRATLELYDSNLSGAKAHADVADRLSVSGPLREYIGATRVMIDALNGEHDRAIHKGRHLLLERPRFLPVMRHLVGSFVATGQLEQAEEMLSDLRRLDPDFATAVMLEEAYALPSDMSREFVVSALRKSGLMN
ncbi:MAG: hypothetical protein ABJG75_14375 [Roseobacter sp.]